MAFIIIALFSESLTLKSLPLKDKSSRLDLPGTAILVPPITCLLLAMQWGGGQYEWPSWRVILLLVVFAILLVAFVLLQCHRLDRATLPPRIALQRNILFGSLFSCWNNGALSIL